MRPRRLAHTMRALLLALCALTLLLSLAALRLEQQRAAAPPPRYLLQDRGGRLCLYSAEGTLLRRYDDILTRLLPEQDAEDLLCGVFICTDSELQERIEDYGG
ncbi:MAG: hypothetical protein RR075_01305 [Pygmaiobacter sp.]